MNIKKLIASAAIALGALLNIGVANAQLNVTANASASNVYSLNSGSTALNSLDTGVGGTNYNLNYSHTSYNADPGLFDVSNMPWWGNPALALDLAQQSHYVGTDTYGVGFAYGLSQSGLTTNGVIFAKWVPTWNSGAGAVIFCDSGCTPLAYAGNWATGSIATPPPSSGGGGVAPEMNASMIPQVGLLLACLFFLFGRKKDTTEVLLTA